MQKVLTPPSTLAPPEDVQPRVLNLLRATLVSLVLALFVLPIDVTPIIMLSLVAGWLSVAVLSGRAVARSPLTFPLLGVLAATALATLFSVDQRSSFPGLVSAIILVGLFFVASNMLAAGWSPLVFVGALVLMATVLMAHGLWTAFQWHWNWWQMRVPEYPPFLLTYRLFALTHPNLLTALVNLALPFAILGLTHACGWAARLGWSLWLVAADLVLFFADSRGGLITTVVIVGLCVVWLMAQHHRANDTLVATLRRGWQIPVTLFGFLSLFVLLRLSRLVASPSEFSTHGGGFTGDRTTFWSVAWQAFVQHPLTGGGPQTYPRMYVDTLTFNRWWIGSHAHNLYLNILGEQGLLGGLAFAALVLVGMVTLIRAWWVVALEQRPLLLGVSAALAGFLVHSLVDVVTAFPLNAVMVVLLAAVGMHLAQSRSRAMYQLPRLVAVLALIPLACIPLLVHYNTAADAQVRSVLQAQAGNWQGAAQALDQALATDPHFAFFYGQRAFAHGVQALPVGKPIDQQALTLALRDYDEAMRREPRHVPNFLNQAALLRASGDEMGAREVLTLAAQHGSEWALPALLLGDHYATLGQDAEAEEWFVRAFAAEPHARYMAACQQSPTCRRMVEQASHETDKLELAHREARALLAAGQPKQALVALERVPFGSAAPQPWLDRADAHLALQQLPQAAYALRVAGGLDAGAPATAIHAALSQSALALAQGQPDAAIAALEQRAWPQIRVQAYDFYVFGRVGLPGQLLPRVELLQQTSEHLELYRRLAELYRLGGRAADAAWAEQQVEALEPLLVAHPQP
ncbi:MAG: O-antigen ligase family protein [Chloroflexota bacterium]|nr:O-antigen ligase family protein [Chloroflexota bacterium]